MKDKEINLVKSILGEDFFLKLEKAELFKLNTKTTLDPDEIKISLQIVPRTIISYLISELKYLNPSEFKEITLPFAPGILHINKLDSDVYSGEIYSLDHKKLYEFKYRSLPSIGLILLSTFELYNLESPQEELLNSINQDKYYKPIEEKVSYIQEIIDERLNLHNSIKNYIDNKISEKEIINNMILNRLKEDFLEEDKTDKKMKLKNFLESVRKKKEESVFFNKNEKINCIDCNTTIYKSGDSDIKLCICFGEYARHLVKIKKKDNNKISLKFPKGFDQENIEMLLDTIKKIKNS